MSLADLQKLATEALVKGRAGLKSKDLVDLLLKERGKRNIQKRKLEGPSPTGKSTKRTQPDPPQPPAPHPTAAAPAPPPVSNPAPASVIRAPRPLSGYNLFYHQKNGQPARKW
jgi:hypothetical protein